MTYVQGPTFGGRPKGHSSRTRATNELPGCRIKPTAVFICTFDLRERRLSP